MCVKFTTVEATIIAPCGLDARPCHRKAPSPWDDLQLVPFQNLNTVPLVSPVTAADADADEWASSTPQRLSIGTGTAVYRTDVPNVGLGYEPGSQSIHVITFLNARDGWTSEEKSRSGSVTEASAEACIVSHK